ncbi:MAG TPA: carboxypeptidase-like regulatory domain-containing protein [Bacteroidia bacterium]|nr:carboxypeptidase-like regulatory domain-containing protein [Bacteroidia bacterium]
MKNQIQKSFIFLFTLFILSSLITSCKKDDDNNSNPFPPSGVTLKTSVLGTVTNTDGLIVSGVTVKLGVYTTTTDTRGNFQFINAEVPKDRMVIVATKDGYFKCVRAKRTQSGEANYINLLMEEKPAAVNVSGAAGGVVNIPGGAKITFPANAFVDAAGNAYTGNVKVFARHISPGDDNFEAIVPGGDLSGINLAGQTKSLYSLGMIEALLTDNTGLSEVKLATGKTAELKFPIDPSQTASAQSTVPMWHMNETTGIWKEEGEAVKTGNFFVGNVSHFSSWNCDYQGERTDLQGKVVDCDNNPMPGIVVTINGFMNIVTDNNGVYSTWVPSGFVIEAQALAVYNPIILNDSPVQTITAVGGVLNIMPPIIASCATRLSGAVGNCAGTELVPATIYASWNGGNYFIYSSTGNYTLYVPPSMAIVVSAMSGNLTGSKNVQSGIQGSQTTVSPLKICANSNVGRNAFTISHSTGVFTSYVVNTLSSTSDFVDSNGDGAFESANINIYGKTVPGNYNCNILINVSNQSGGIYSLAPGFNNVQISIDSVMTYVSGTATGITLNKLVFTDYSQPGGFATGDFEFDSNSGTISAGEFSVFRTN